MHAVAFICKYVDAGIQGLFVQLLQLNPTGAPTVLAQGITNKDGYVLFNYVPVNITGTVFVWGPGYQNLQKDVKLGDANQNIDLQVLPSFNKPSRDRIINVKANLCNVRDAEDIPVFEIFISTLLAQGQLSKARNWLDVLRKFGSTHVNLAISYDYNENLGWAPRYPIEGMDFTQNLPAFGSIITWIQQQGFIPIVKLAFDGQGYDPVGKTYGWQWGMDNIERIANGLSQFTNTILWSTGFDGCFPDWTPDQTVDMLRKMRAVLGEKACIDTEFAGPGTWGYIHLGDGEASWVPDKLGILDHFSLEAQTFPINLEGLQQIATRLLGPNCKIGPKQPYYLAALEKTIAIDVYETNAYWSIRKQIMPQDAVATANQCKPFGFTSYGNGVPSI